MANQWFKFYGGEYLSDPKIGRLTASERSCWLTLLCMASMAEDGIIEYLEVDDLLTKSGIRFDPYNEGAWESCQSILMKFSSMKMIKVDSEKSLIEIINWNKRQERTAQTPYERVKKHRKNKAKLENDNANDNGDNENDNDRIEEKRREENNITTKVVEEAPEEFNFEDYLNTMKEDNNKAIQLIRVFFMEKKLKFKTKKEIQLAITRNIKEANTLMKTFEIEDVIEAIEFVKDKYPDIWTLETLSKYLINHRIIK